jgi:NAD(P)-dependent dehydrogenase (short-subunit alcohol dehydrogenase family)
LTPKRLKDRIALITGASRGIGRAVALAYAREGAHVLLLARARKSLEPVDDAIEAEGGTATLIPLNLAHGLKIDALGGSTFSSAMPRCSAASRRSRTSRRSIGSACSR